MGDPVRCLPKVVHPDVAALKLQHNRNLVTAGDVVFQGTDSGAFYALDALSGAELFVYEAPRSIRSSPLTYQVDGKQYVSVVATTAVLTFSVP